MPSLVWTRDPQEAFENPYEYDAQDQFCREAEPLLKQLYELLAHNPTRRHYRTERTADKAIWLLHLDALGSLADAFDNLRRKRHRVIPHLSRNIQEVLDFAAVLWTQTPKAVALLNRWFDDEIISYGEYRSLIPEPKDQAADDARKKRYRNLSRYTHRTYHALMEGYGLGSDDHVFHDQSGMTFDRPPEALGFVALPQTISAYYTVIASDIHFFAEELIARGTVTKDAVDHAFITSLETETVPRRFMPTGKSKTAQKAMREMLARARERTSRQDTT